MLPLIALLQPYFKAFSVVPSAKLPISPLAGEMPGKAEGGAVPPTCQPNYSHALRLFPVENG
ncbi:MAG: hypothetical protein E5X43_23645 [Mesorhizobium sp.]|nr:MAG: hypothetical protein E5X51_12870 [Mesorhizobium sp.]TJW82660.1 MAG: hypothetical protein E5X43_23645 [Mesorhizobium sp.]BCH15627.1 hypothetical protein MesoLjLa_24780 [Mesorhizobium sp. L-2-11]